MTAHPSIRSLYSPVQPAAAAVSYVDYTEYAPDPRLQNLIYCYWDLKTGRPLQQAFNYHVVTDGCIDIFFDVQNPSGKYVMGLSTAYTRFSLGRLFHYAGIRFLPGAFPQIARIKAAELTNRCEDLSLIAPNISKDISECFDPGPDTLENRLNHLFLLLVRQTEPEYDPRLYRALQTIFQAGGNLRIRKQLNPGISNRQLCRLFNTYIGGTPKLFSKIVRFQQLLRVHSSGNKTMAFLDAGYFDQAHFIKDFKNLSGLTPSGLFG